jgi:hypothetical protein
MLLNWWGSWGEDFLERLRGTVSDRIGHGLCGGLDIVEHVGRDPPSKPDDVSICVDIQDGIFGYNEGQSIPE